MEFDPPYPSSVDGWNDAIPEPASMTSPRDTLRVPPVLVFASDRYPWLLPGFAYLFNMFWGSDWPAIVVGVSAGARPELPHNFRYTDIGAGAPAAAWSDSLRAALKALPSRHYIFAHEDYYLIRPVDRVGVLALVKLAAAREDIIRLDLTDDRLYAYGDARNAKPAGTCSHLDLIETFSRDGLQYQMSHQSAIFNRNHVLNVVAPGRSPWDVEMYTDLKGFPELKVIGTRQAPVRYANILKTGEIQRDELDRVPEPHRSRVAGAIARSREQYGGA